jgi:hypothetical protein
MLRLAGIRRVLLAVMDFVSCDVILAVVDWGVGSVSKYLSSYYGIGPGNTVPSWPVEHIGRALP